MTDYERGYLQGKADALATQTTASCINRSDIIRMAWKANLPSCHITHPKALERFFHLAVAHEREECAKWAELVAREIDNTHNTANYIASGIRARGEK